MPEEKIEEAPEVGKAEESIIAEPESPDVIASEVPAEPIEKPESEPEAKPEEEKKEDWDRDKAEKFFQTQHAEEKKLREAAEEKLLKIEEYYDTQAPPKPVEESKLPQPALDPDDEGLDLQTAAGQKQYQEGIVQALTGQVSSILSERDNKSEAQGRQLAEADHCRREYDNWADKCKVPTDMRNEVVNKLITDFPYSRPTKIFKQAMENIELMGYRESMNKIRAKTEADTSKKMKKLIDNKPPPSGVPPEPHKGSVETADSVIEKKMGPQEGHDIL